MCHLFLENQAKIMYKITEKDCYGEKSKLFNSSFAYSMPNTYIHVQGVAIRKGNPNLASYCMCGN